ncbi:MAG: Coenzyme F420-dependent N5,N10-methylene tetrahydromethanopterin reductase-related flavin-dependent [Ilumatobacteraceae bacterium]|nr:Coenzyme F420-dependent N5,N10-methylene tetrahydromethanopterin reductase-related flavin-dependent [Ilumatobacteraceae bacterium]
MSVETAVPFQLDRSVDPKLAGVFAAELYASGAVDYIMAWDQLVSWYPKSLWTEENTPIAAVMKDCDSFADVFVLAAIAAASSNIGISVSTDSIRRGPAELTQTMLTLAGATQGRSILMLGAGEMKQARPYGHKRSEGLDRMEDFFEINRRLTGATEPFDYEGKHTTYKNAWIGGAAPYKPRIHALGGGPRLLEMAAKYADGYSFAVPSVFTSPEQFAETATKIRQAVERNGRDPDAFEFSMWYGAAMHEDPEMIERLKQNALFKFFAAGQARIDQSEWVREGIQPAYDTKWHYAINLLPQELSAEDCAAVLSRVSPELVDHAIDYGEPASVAANIQGYIDAGVTYVSVVDLLPPLMLPLEEQLPAMSRSIEVCALLKKNAV